MDKIKRMGKMQTGLKCYKIITVRPPYFAERTKKLTGLIPPRKDETVNVGH